MERTEFETVESINDRTPSPPPTQSPNADSSNLRTNAISENDKKPKKNAEPATSPRQERNRKKVRDYDN